MRQTVIVVVIILLLGSLFANSQTKMSRREYIEAYKNIAIREMHRSGIPASITMAQGCLESSNGNSVLSRKSNNHFGIKCKSNWKGARVFHNDDKPNECFRVYAYVEDSYIDHADFLLGNSRYAYLFKLSHTDYVAWAKGLKKAGYATDPKYADHLIKIIEDEKLHVLDNVKPGDVPEYHPILTENKTSQSFNEVQQKLKNTFDNIKLNPYEKREVKQMNGLDIIYTRAGDTYERIAREFDLKTWEMYHYNDLPTDATEPKPNTFLYIERKRYNAPKGNDFHVIKPTETLQQIAQQYGMKQSALRRKNRMEKDEKPIAGNKLFLRKRKPKSN